MTDFEGPRAETIARTETAQAVNRGKLAHATEAQRRPRGQGGLAVEPPSWTPGCAHRTPSPTGRRWSQASPTWWAALTSSTPGTPLAPRRRW